MNSKKILLTILLAVGTVIITLGVLISQIDTEPKKLWAEMSYEEKQVWIENFLKHPDDGGYALVYLMNEGVKQKFNFPDEVEFDEIPAFDNATVVEADSGWVFVAGTGTAKNAFGVKSRFSYQCKLTITDSLRRLDEININTR